MWCLLELATFSRTRALALIILGSITGGFLIDLDHPLQAAIQGKSIFDMDSWLIPHGRFLHIPVLILAFALLVFSASFLAGWMLDQPHPMQIRTV